MHLKDLKPLILIRQAHFDAAVKPPFPQQRRVQRIQPVGSGEDDNAVAFGKAAHFGQQGVQRLFPFVVPAVPFFTDGVDLVDEDHAAPRLPRFAEQLPHPGRAHAHIDLYEVRAAHGEKGSLGFSRQRPGQQGFTCARRAVEQHALGGTGPVIRKALGFF